MDWNVQLLMRFNRMTVLDRALKVITLSGLIVSFTFMGFCCAQDKLSKDNDLILLEKAIEIVDSESKYNELCPGNSCEKAYDNNFWVPSKGRNLKVVFDVTGHAVEADYVPTLPDPYHVEKELIVNYLRNKINKESDAFEIPSNPDTDDYTCKFVFKKYVVTVYEGFFSVKGSYENSRKRLEKLFKKHNNLQLNLVFSFEKSIPLKKRLVKPGFTKVNSIIGLYSSEKEIEESGLYSHWCYIDEFPCRAVVSQNGILLSASCYFNNFEKSTDLKIQKFIKENLKLNKNIIETKEKRYCVNGQEDLGCISWNRLKYGDKSSQILSFWAARSISNNEKYQSLKKHYKELDIKLNSKAEVPTDKSGFLVVD